MPRSIFVAALALVAGLAGAAAPTAVEYYHGGYGHYFVTASPQEVAALDAGTLPGWSRTGHGFDVFELGAPGTAGVCRFWSGQTFVPKSSHFYDASVPRCMTAANRDWKFEGEVFGLARPDPAGACAWGTQPLYRLYNNGISGAPNHRYTTSLAVRSDMLAQGWIAEGAGIGVVGCVPLPQPDAFTIVAAGDIAQCSNAPAALSGAAQTAALVTPDDALVLTLGDNVYDRATPSEFANCFHPTWGAFRDRIRPAIGNHEYGVSGADGYFGYFGAQAGPDRGGYYSFDHQGWHFIALNSMIDAGVGSAQYQWLLADLAASSATLCTIAYWHYPAFSSGQEHGSYDKMLPAFAALHAAGVEIVLVGDEHFYERFAPQNAQGVRDPARGVRQFVVGTGGARLYPFGAPLPTSEFRYNASHGVLRLTLGADGYRWQFVPTGGAAPLDPGSAACHR